MDSWPTLAITLLSYKRPAEAIRTVNGLCDNLVYSGEKVWYVADDGSETGEFMEIIDALYNRKQTIIGSHRERFSPTPGVGWNKGLGICHQATDYVLMLEDDWELDQPLHIEPWIEMLAQREDVGIVRLSGLSVGNHVEIVGHNGHHYLKYLRNKQYAYSGNPHIRHARFVRKFGWFSEEKLNPGELELNYDGRFRATEEPPDIWRPADLPGWGVFRHIGQVRYR